MYQQLRCSRCNLRIDWDCLGWESRSQEGGLAEALFESILSGPEGAQYESLAECKERLVEIAPDVLKWLKIPHESRKWMPRPPGKKGCDENEVCRLVRAWRSAGNELHRIDREKALHALRFTAPEVWAWAADAKRTSAELSECIALLQKMLEAMKSIDPDA